MITSLLIPFVLALRLALAQEATPGPGKFFFMWPTQVSQCELVNLTWGPGAVPPFQAWVVPIGQQPFIYEIPSSAYVNGRGAYQIQVQLNQGQNYVMLMSDQRGMGSGGTSTLQIVGSSPNTACLNSASRNQTAKEFSFSVAGKAQQCQPGFEVQWDGSVDNAPYNFTVIPLRQDYYPFDVPLDDLSGYSSDWVLNMTAGTRFTIVMNNKNKYGSGGAAGIYEVANNTQAGSKCIAQSIQGTGAWPIGVATNTLPVATNPPQSPSTSSGITGGAIAGIVIGVLALLALVGFLVWFLLRRRRRRTEVEEHAAKGTELDLADSNSTTGPDEGYTDAQVGPSTMPIVSPYPSDGRYSVVPDHERRSYSDGRTGDGNMSERERDSGVWGATTSTSAGFAGLGAGRDRDSRNIAGEGERREGPGMAGPLPSKSPVSHSPRLSSPSNRPFANETPNAMPAYKRDHLSLPPGASSGPSAPSGPMRIVNHDNPQNISAVPMSESEMQRRRESRMMQFRRHEDAGRVDIVDLPPLYTDVPRERDREGGGREGEGEEDVGETSPLSPNNGYGR